MKNINKSLLAVVVALGCSLSAFADGDTFSTFSDKTEHYFGEHLGAGAELMLGPRTSVDLDVRYIFINATNEDVIHRDFNYWQITFGLNFFF